MDNDNPSASSVHSKGITSYALSGKIMLSAIVILFGVVIVMVGLHLYARWYLLRQRRRDLLRRRRRTHIVFYVADNPHRGLEPAVLNALPVFVYSQGQGAAALECAVCLSEFEENDKGRVLPKCNHSFHSEFIDMWFHSHATCPLCRTPVEAQDISMLGLDPIEIPTARNDDDLEMGVNGTATAASSSSSPRLLSFKRILSLSMKTPAGDDTCSGANHLDLEAGIGSVTNPHPQ